MRRRLPLAIATGTALGLMVLVAILLPKEGGGLWPGYRILLVEAKVAESRVLESLAGAGIKNVLSECNQPVQISNYETVVTLDLPEAAARLTEGDVRRDAYIAGLPKWYRASTGGAEYRIYYLKSGAAEGLAPRLDSGLKGLGAGWILPETVTRDGHGPLRLLAFILFLAIACLVTGKAKDGLLALLLALPWSALAFDGWTGFGLALSWLALNGLLVKPALAALDEQAISSELPASARAFLSEALPSLPLWASALGVLGLNAAFLPAAFAAMASSVAAFIAFALADGRMSRRRRAFRPLRIGRFKGRPLSFRGPRPGAAFLAFVLAALSVSMLALAGLVPPASKGPTHEAPQGAIVLPQPFIKGGRPNPLPAEASILASKEDLEGKLVGAADWLLHRWYQEALFYIPLNERDLPAFSSVSVPLPGQKSAALRVFDAAWAKEAWSKRPAGGIESLFLAEPAFVECRFAPYSGENRRPLAPITGLLYIILLVPPLVGAASLGKNVFRSGREHR